LIDSKKREYIAKYKEEFFTTYKKLFEGVFYSGIKNATGTEEHVRIRYRELNAFIDNF